MSLVHAEDFPTLWLEKGKISPYSGYLWSEEKTLNALQYKLELNLYKEENLRLTKRIEMLESKSEWEKWLYIGIGAGLVLIAGWSLGQVKKDVTIIRF